MQHQQPLWICRAKVALSILVLALAVTTVDANVIRKSRPFGPEQGVSSITVPLRTDASGKSRSAADYRDEVTQLIYIGAYDNCIVRPDANPNAVIEPLTLGSAYAKTYRASVFAPLDQGSENAPNALPNLEDVALAVATEMSSNNSTRVLIYNKILQVMEVMIARRILRNAYPELRIKHVFTDDDVVEHLTKLIESANGMSLNK